MRRILLAVVTPAVCLTVLLAATGVRAQDADVLVVEKAKLRWKTHRKTGAARDTLTLKTVFPDRTVLKEFDPSVHSLTITIGDLDLFVTDAPQDAKAFRLRGKLGARRAWSLKEKGEAGDRGRRKLSVNVRKQTLNVSVKRAFLRDASLSDPDDIPVTVTIGDVTASTTISFDRRSDFDWRYRRLPSGGGPGPVGPVTWDLVATGSLSNVSKPNIEIARSDTELAALWNAYGRSGSPPVVDFEQDMIVAISTQIRGPGQSPPQVFISGVTGAGSAIRIDWYLAGCEWNQCPGAPAPVTCPTATPFRILRMTRADGVNAVQGQTLYVCP